MVGDRVFSSRLNLEKREGDLSNEEILAGFTQQKVTIVLQDPAYVSETLTVSLKRNSDRHRMAIAKFETLAGCGGFGSWCVAQHLGESRLFAWAIDSGSLEAVRLREMVKSGVQIDRITTQTLLLPLTSELKDTAQFLRVHCTGSSIQIALMLNKHWVFVRRVDTSSATYLEAVQSSLVHLKAQFYLDDPTVLLWQLIADDEIKKEMSALWASDKPCLPMPFLLGDISENVIPLNFFNSIDENSQQHSLNKLVLLRSVASTIIVLLLSYLLPPIALSIEEPKYFPAVDSDDEPIALSNRYWQMSIMIQQKNHSAENVSNRLQRLLLLTEQGSEIKLASMSTDSLENFNLHFIFENSISDPVERLSLQKKLSSRLEIAMPEYKVIVLKNKRFEVGEVRIDSKFEVSLDKFRE